MPDALSKTVPIWCAVWNRVLFPEDVEAHALHTPPQCVSPSEHSQIERRLDDFVSKLRELELDFAELREKISKPMRPMWITRDSDLLEGTPEFAGFHPVVLCTASRRVHGTEVSEGGYIQGAGDDSEGWAHGLTANIFWKHKEAMMSTNDEDLPDLILTLLGAEKATVSRLEPVLIKPTNWLFAHQIYALDDSLLSKIDCLITCAQTAQVVQLQVMKGKHLHLECREKKLGSRDLRKEFGKLVTFMSQLKSPKRLLVCCPTGKDLSIGIILAILCLYTDEQGRRCINCARRAYLTTETGKFTVQATSPSMNKAMIRQRLSWIMTSFPSALPSRATLQSVNDFLLTTAPAVTRIPQQIQDPIYKYRYILDLFKSLAGEWTIDRDIVNFRNDGLAGVVTGSATFESRNPTSADTASEYLYIETGNFTTTTGMVMQATRRWIWRYHNTSSEEGSSVDDVASTDAPISVHFVKADGETEDYIYNMLTFAPKDEIENESGGHVLKARAEHPCGEDFYVSTYEFHLGERSGIRLGKFEVQHEVKGPSKDYISHTVYIKQR
jgi:tRNA A64-2'-O-ribosylphosphate transferase